MGAITSGAESHCFDGRMGFYKHLSIEIGAEMRFSVYLPPLAARTSVPVLYYLAGLTCTEETFMIKSGAQRLAAKLGLMLVACDTSPRGLMIPGEEEDWDFGTGAGFYLDATETPWAANYRMYSYVSKELPALIEANFPALADRRGIFGHSMGGHGALTIALKNPERYRSVSAFSPIANPVSVPWGEKAFGKYLGPDRSRWTEYDSSLLIQARPFPRPILVDQGEDDQFLAAQLHPDALTRAATASGQSLTLRRHDGYDHSYWFVQTFMEDHLTWHAEQLL